LLTFAEVPVSIAVEDHSRERTTTSINHHILLILLSYNCNFITWQQAAHG